MDELISVSETKMPVDEITARRAVAGADADILEAGGTPKQAEAVQAALRLWFLKDFEGARAQLAKAFQNGMVERLMSAFARGAPN